VAALCERRRTEGKGTHHAMAMRRWNMRKSRTAIGFIGAVVVAFANVPTISAQSDELPRRLGERINRPLVNDGFPSVAAGGFDTEKKITASDGAIGDFFGVSVAISGDTAIVGAYYDDDNGSNSGSAYLYRRDEGGVDNWGEVTKIIASDGAGGIPFGDIFGYSVAISGDTAIVGAFHDDDDGPSSGSAYVYHRDEGGVDNWGEVIKITASDGAADDEFGYSVAISGDTAIVGARNNEDTGSAYVYRRDEGGMDNWGEVTKITASDGAANDEFGGTVAISGDTAIVGVRLDDDNGSASGSAYVFQRDEGGADTWGQVAKITASDGAASDLFGISVAISGDRAIVGAYRDDDHGPSSGSAYVYGRNEGGVNNWGQVTKITASDGAGDISFGDEFGASVAISGNTAVVGATGHQDNGLQSGSAYVYRRDEGGVDNWGEVTKITASDGAGQDAFSNSVAISGNAAIVGAFGRDDNGSLSGSAYVYFGRRPVPAPAVAEWGVMAMTLLLLAMTIKFGHRRRVTR